MAQSKFLQAHTNLMACHKEIRGEFGDLDDQTLARFFGNQDSPELRRQIREHGDGHALCSVPRTVDEMKAVDAVVLFAVTSPKLNQRSAFNRLTPLHTIPYWRDDKRLRHTLSTRTRRYKLHFMSWQQNFSIHGIDDAHARTNLNLLLKHRPNLDRLFKREKAAAIEFVAQCSDWLTRHGNSMVAITQTGRANFSEPISGLIANSAVIRIEAQLRGKNYRIMERIRESLP